MAVSITAMVKVCSSLGVLLFAGSRIWAATGKHIIGFEDHHRLKPKNRARMLRTLIFALIATLAPAASCEMVITEWMYSGIDGEFVEFTNVGATPVDMSGWSFDNAGRTPGTVDLSAFGLVAAGESVILTEAVAADFAAAWQLTDVNIIGGLTANLTRNDQINLYDSSDVLVDQLSYGDEDYPGTPRTQYASCNIPESDYDRTIARTDWTLAAVGDEFGSRMSTGGDIASPGRIVGYASSDYDMDGDVDLSDLAVFVSCYCGDPADPLCCLIPDANGIVPADADMDGDVDLADFAAFAGCYSSEEPGVTQIILNGDSIAVYGTGVTVDATTATITAPGAYNISGILNDGQIAVDSPTTGVVEIILNGVNISNSTSAAVNVIDASFVSIVLADQTQNYLFDADQYIYADPNQDEPSACLFSDDSMSISGPGALTVYGNYNDAVVSKNELIIYGGAIDVISTDDGIRGKDYLLILDGDITLTTVGDALKSDCNDDPNLGYIAIEGGSLDIASGRDGIAAETDVTVVSGDITIVSGGGHTAAISEELSAKGIKGLVSVVIEGGTLDLDCADDGLHSNDTVMIVGGASTIASGQDAIHADVAVGINGGAITVTDSYEAIESTNITIIDGDIDIASDEDAITAETAVDISGGRFDIFSGGGHTARISDDLSAKGIKGVASVVIDGGTFVMDCADDAIHSNDAVTIHTGTFVIATADDAVHADSTVEINGGAINITNSYEGIESADVTINGGDIHITSSDDGINGAGGDGSGGEWPPPHHPPGGGGDYYLYINGGCIAINAAGDGVDVNGNIEMTGGALIVNGPTADNNNAVDFDGTCNISGGLLVAVGSSRMAQALSSSSSQRSVKITYSQWKTAGTLIHIEMSTAGADVLTFAPAKSYQSCVFSSPDLQAGASYRLYSGGSSTGTVTDGLYQGGTYTPGTQTNTFTTTNIVTSINAP